jgi:hypothetical protein
MVFCFKTKHHEARLHRLSKAGAFLKGFTMAASFMLLLLESTHATT